MVGAPGGQTAADWSGCFVAGGAKAERRLGVFGTLRRPALVAQGRIFQGERPAPIDGGLLVRKVRLSPGAGPLGNVASQPDDSVWAAVPLGGVLGIDITPERRAVSLPSGVRGGLIVAACIGATEVRILAPRILKA